ncbi:MAG: S8 family peptidase [Gelidibacter sp.]|nr:S8 family peptidase [Gelidibacter sp.]
MPNKNHLKLLSNKQLEKIIPMKFIYGFGKKDEDEDEEQKNYYRIAQALSIDRIKFDKEIQIKKERKDTTLKIPYNINHVLFTFQGQFVIKDFFNKYYTDFGLEAIDFYDFGKKGLFAIIDQDKFQLFLNEINKFIEKEYLQSTDIEYDNYVLYIASFKLLQINEILKFRLDLYQGLIYLSLISLPLNEGIKSQILISLYAFLDEKGITYKFDELNERIELDNPNPELLRVIIENFDIIESVTNSVFTTVRPGEFNTVTRQQAFTIINAEEELPIIGIIDTGISATTALGSIIIEDRTFTLNGDPLVDVANRNRLGHGTPVAGLVALGKLNHGNSFNGEVRADAKLLSIKISENGNGHISEIDLIKMLYDVKVKYPQIKIFTLTTCYNRFKNVNENFSDYTFALDKFAYDTDSLIFICTANNDDCINNNSAYDLTYFNSNNTNLCTPADSMNNMTIGAAGDNLGTGAFMGISSGREFPALYSRKGHVDLSLVFPKNKTNKNYFKPDIIESGGDVGFYNSTTLDWTDDAAMELISARPDIGLVKEAGTSFATPLTANLAAKIQKQYPELHPQTIKALIINSASLNKIPFDKSIKKLQNRVAGHGFVDNFKSVFSNENSVTLILEDSITDDDLKIYPINFPNYLIEDDLGKKNGIVKVTATLCFSFLPIKNNQLSYNPLHMAFSIFKNHSAEDIIKTNEDVNSKLKSTLSWSQNGRYKSKPLPYSNSQKIILNVNVNDLVNEENTFKLALHCMVTEQIVGGIPGDYPKEFPFSLVINIEENTKVKTDKLYDEIQLINEVEVIGELEIDTDLDIEGLDA